jgi:peptidoglycan/LPS O-acetylase OafA/YrhL
MALIQELLVLPYPYQSGYQQMQDIRPTTGFNAQQKPPQNSGARSGNLAVIFNSMTMDVGRILAASVIFYFHVGLVRHCPLSTYGEFAVEYFVILSGISYILFSSTKPSTPSEYLEYIKKRLAALFPVFCLVNIFLYIGSFYYPSELGRPYRFVEFLASTTGASMYLGWKYMSTVMWFMPFIMQVYLLIPLVDWWARRINPVILLLVAFCLSCLFAHMVPIFAKNDRVAELVCKTWSPIFRLPEVCVGVILGRSAHMRCDYWKGMMAVAVFGIMSLLVSLLKSANVISHLYMPWSGFIVPAILFGASALISPMLRSVNAKVMRLLGLSSFFFYLSHAAALLAIRSRFGNQIYVWVSYYLACWFVAVGVTLIFANFKKMFEGWRHRPKN